TGRIAGENLPQGTRPLERGIGNAEDEGRSIQRQPVLSRFHLQVMLGFVESGIDGYNLLFAIAADRVVMLEAETDGVDQAVARGAGSVGKMGLEHLAIRERLLIGGR